MREAESVGAALQASSRVHLWSPPLRLRAVPDRYMPLFRMLWFLCFTLAIAAVVLGLVHAIRETYEVRPVFSALALDYDLEDNGQISIRPESRPHSKYRLLAIDGEAVDPYIHIPQLADRLKAAPGPVVTLDLAAEDGSGVKLEQERETRPVDP
ncbi:MAG TPA: hypothetical protein VH392_10955, partial [Sphingomicrobium sp.]